jgi:tetratricopeptide (TPR) repeat protein
LLKAKTHAADGPASARRRRWFRAIAVAVPLVNLVLLELILRAAGFGYPTAFFLQTRVNGQAVFIENQQFSRRYFPPGLERTPQPALFPAVKPTNAIRLFVLGESAAMGDPEPAFGFPRILEVLLREALPGRRIEIINTAVTAINSHVIREIARDCAGKQGDYWLVYMGNNEVVGPFGAGTIFGGQTPGLAFIRANLAIKSTRLGQLLDAIRHKLTRRSDTPATWEGMEMFLQQQVAPEDPRLQKVYAHFESNLRDILRLGGKAGAKILLSTVAVNLKDCPPFASQHRRDLDPERRAQWEHFYQAGRAHERNTNHTAALNAYQQAARLDDRHAELHFRMGRCHWALGKFTEATLSFELARDLDVLRFRADSKVNKAVDYVASGFPPHGVRNLWMHETVARQSDESVPGEEFFYEHVHFNFSGNYLVARAFAEQILSGGTNHAPLLTEAECARRLAFTDFHRYRVLDEVRQRLQQPPFNTQLDHDARDRRLQQQLDRLDRASFSNAVQTYEQAIARAPDDWVLRENFATLLQDFNQPREAEAHWRKVIQLLPHAEQAWFGLANLLDAQGRSGEAIAAFREALRRRPASLEARNGLALALGNAGRTAESIAEFERALRQNPGFVEARINLGQTLAQQGRHVDAAAQYSEVLRRHSNNVPARINLGKLLAGQRQFAEAAAHYREALRLKPDSAVAHFNLGNTLNALGEYSAAITHFAEAVRHHPHFAEARYHLGLGYARQNRDAEALVQLSEAARLKPDFAEARFNLGVALAKAQRYDEAIEQFRETLRLDPGNAAAKKFLEQAQARLRQAQ